MSLAAFPPRLPRIEDGPLAPVHVARARADWCEIETLLSAPPTFPVATDQRSSRTTPLLLAAAFVAIAVATAVPVARGWYPGARTDGADVAAQPAATPAGQAARQVASGDTPPNLAEGRSAAEAADQPAPAPIIRHRHRHRPAR